MQRNDELDSLRSSLGEKSGQIEGLVAHVLDLRTQLAMARGPTAVLAPTHAARTPQHEQQHQEHQEHGHQYQQHTHHHHEQRTHRTTQHGTGTTGTGTLSNAVDSGTADALSGSLGHALSNHATGALNASLAQAAGTQLCELQTLLARRSNQVQELSGKLDAAIRDKHALAHDCQAHVRTIQALESARDTPGKTETEHSDDEETRRAQAVEARASVLVAKERADRAEAVERTLTETVRKLRVAENQGAALKTTVARLEMTTKESQIQCTKLNKECTDLQALLGEGRARHGHLSTQLSALKSSHAAEQQRRAQDFEGIVARQAMHVESLSSQLNCQQHIMEKLIADKGMLVEAMQGTLPRPLDTIPGGSPLVGPAHVRGAVAPGPDMEDQLTTIMTDHRRRIQALSNREQNLKSFIDDLEYQETHEAEMSMMAEQHQQQQQQQQTAQGSGLMASPQTRRIASELQTCLANDASPYVAGMMQPDLLWGRITSPSPAPSPAGNPALRIELEKTRLELSASVQHLKLLEPDLLWGRINSQTPVDTTGANTHGRLPPIGEEGVAHGSTRSIKGVDGAGDGDGDGDGGSAFSAMVLVAEAAAEADTGARTATIPVPASPAGEPGVVLAVHGQPPDQTEVRFPAWFAPLQHSYGAVAHALAGMCGVGRAGPTTPADARVHTLLSTLHRHCCDLLGQPSIEHHQRMEHHRTQQDAHAAAIAANVAALEEELASREMELTGKDCRIKTLEDQVASMVQNQKVVQRAVQQARLETLSSATVSPSKPFSNHVTPNSATVGPFKPVTRPAQMVAANLDSSAAASPLQPLRPSRSTQAPAHIQEQTQEQARSQAQAHAQAQAAATHTLDAEDTSWGAVGNSADPSSPMGSSVSGESSGMPSPTQEYDALKHLLDKQKKKTKTAKTKTKEQTKQLKYVRLRLAHSTQHLRRSATPKSDHGPLGARDTMSIYLTRAPHRQARCIPKSRAAPFQVSNPQ